MHDFVLNIPIKEPLADAIIALSKGKGMTPNNPISRIHSFLRKSTSGYEIVCPAVQIEEIIASLLSVMIAANDLLNAIEEQGEMIDKYKKQIEEMTSIINSCFGHKTDKMN